MNFNGNEFLKAFERKYSIAEFQIELCDDITFFSITNKFFSMNSYTEVFPKIGRIDHAVSIKNRNIYYFLSVKKINLDQNIHLFHTKLLTTQKYVHQILLTDLKNLQSKIANDHQKLILYMNFG